MEELYRELCELFGEVVGSKTQTYEMLNYYRNNYITEVCELNRAIDEIIDGDLLYQKNNYRIAMLELPGRFLQRSWMLDKDEWEFLMFLVRCTYSFPGCVGTPLNIYKLKDNAHVMDIGKIQEKSGSDGFCTEYMISQMKGGLSLDILVGCPMGCRYCYRIENENMSKYINKWNPTVIIQPEEIVQRLMKHPWFTPHVSGIGIHMSTTEAFLEQIWPYTIQILSILDGMGLTNRVSIITKYTLDDEKIELLGNLQNISLDICVCYSGMPQCIEPSSDSKRMFFLEKLVKAERKYPNIHAIGYYRPIIEGYNTSLEKIKETVELIKHTGVKVVVFGGLKYTDVHDSYFMEMALPRPRGNYVEGKKYLSNQTVDNIFKVFNELYAGDTMPAILRRSSCARVVSRGSWYPDYNAHWTVPNRNCSLNCPQKAVCEKYVVPQESVVRDLLERIGKRDAKIYIDNQVIILEQLTMFERTFMIQNLFCNVMDRSNLIKFVNIDDKLINIIIDNIELFSFEDIKELLNYHEMERYMDLITAIKSRSNNTKDIMQEILWEETYHKIRKEYEVNFEGLQLYLAVTLEILYDYLKRNGNCIESYVTIKGVELFHYIADKILDNNEENVIKKYTVQNYYYFGLNYCKKRFVKDHIDTLMVGFAMIIRAIEAKNKISSLSEAIRVGIIIPMKNEQKRIAYELQGVGDINVIKTKIMQINWLCKDSNVDCEMWFIDDNSSDNTAAVVEGIISEYNSDKYRVIRLSDVLQLNKNGINSNNPILADVTTADEWAKGAAVCWGMFEFANGDKDFVIYTDMDITYPLEQCGNLLYECAKSSVVASIGSRKVADSWGYYGNKGPGIITNAYCRAVAEVYKLDNIQDIQAGFKCFRSSILCNIIDKMYDRKLSFDAELLMLSQKAGTIREVGVAACHKYIEGKEGTHRDYDSMLRDVLKYSKMHGIANEDDLVFTTTILKQGGIYKIKFNSQCMIEKHS